MKKTLCLPIALVVLGCAAGFGGNTGSAKSTNKKCPPGYTRLGDGTCVAPKTKSCPPGTVTRVLPGSKKVDCMAVEKH